MITLFYNDKTQREVQDIIESVNFPKEYSSVQFRGGDKIMEHRKLNKTDEVVKRSNNSDFRQKISLFFQMIINMLKN